jgi:hypothetical protein
MSKLSISDLFITPIDESYVKNKRSKNTLSIFNNNIFEQENEKTTTDESDSGEIMPFTDTELTAVSLENQL